MWVYRTRATLENAFDETPGNLPAPVEPHLPPVDKAFPKLEDDHGGTFHREKGSKTSPPSSPSRWTKRKRGFKLRLELSPQPKRILPTVQSVDGSAASLSSLPPKEHLLDMFEKMMESRMESCERINKLVRRANRAHLHDR